MSDEKIPVVDRRRVKQEDLCPAAVVRTTTLAAKEPAPKSKGKTDAQLAVAKAKAIDEGRPESDIAEPKKKGKPSTPPWSKENKSLQDRRVDSPASKVHAPVQSSKNPLEEAELFESDSGLTWCGCGRALYRLPNGDVVCRDGHQLGVTEGRGPFNWEQAADHLRNEGQTAIQAGVLMATRSSDVAAFWKEQDEKLAKENAESAAAFNALVPGANAGSAGFDPQNAAEELTKLGEQAEDQVRAALESAPIDDEPVSPEEAASAEAARAEPTLTLEVKSSFAGTVLDLQDELRRLDERVTDLESWAPEKTAIFGDLHEVLARVEAFKQKAEPPADPRSLAMVVTKLDEAIMWFKRGTGL